MENKQLIHYESFHCNIHLKCNSSFFGNDYEVIKISDLEKELGYCYGSKQYIMRFIEILKNRVIRFLPDLNKVKIMLGLFDKNNVLHNIIIEIYCLINGMIKKEIEKYFYKTIFTIIEYKGKIVFIGNISFNGID